MRIAVLCGKVWRSDPVPISHEGIKHCARQFTIVAKAIESEGGKLTGMKWFETSDSSGFLEADFERVEVREETENEKQKRFKLESVETIAVMDSIKKAIK